jgi:Rieske Fe-S protein
MSDILGTPAVPPPRCDGCEPARRLFLIRAAQAAAAAIGIAVVPSLARAVPLSHGAPGAPERRYAIPPADGVLVDEDASLVLARHAGSVYALSLACPHKRTAVRWQPATGRFECPKHRSRYQPDGVFISGRATRSMDRFAIRRDGAFVVADTGRMYREDTDVAAWRAAVVQL